MATNLSAHAGFKSIGPRLPAVDRALSLLELLSNSRSGLTLSDISRKLHIPKSSSHYLIHTLATRGYIQNGSDGKHYSLGLRLSDIADSNKAKDEFASRIAPYLGGVALRTGLTTIATVLFGAEAMIIGQVLCPKDSGGGAWAGRHIDLHCTAQGKALIAHLPERRLIELFRGREFAQYTPKTIPTFSALRTHLATVREQGFAVNDEEQVLGGRAVAVPIKDSFGSVIAAVSVRGDTREISTNRIEQLGFDMARVVDRVFRDMRTNL